LEYKDFDFKNGIMEVKRSSAWHNDKRMFADTPKTKSSERCLKLPLNIVDLITCYREYQDREKIKLGDQWIEHDRLFTRWNGEPMFPETPIKYFQRLCKRTGMRYVNI